MRAGILAAAILIHLALFAGMAPAQGPDGQAKPDLFAEVDGIALMARHAPPGVKFDVSITEPRVAMDRLTEALALIRQKSPYSTAQIETLKKNGRVLIVYDPEFPPKDQLTNLLVAAFFPQYPVEDAAEPGRMAFPVVISRHGIKWPLEELAAAIVHELVGHGMQHFEGRLDKMRVNDLECEAWIYEELAFQDFGMDKFSNEMIEFQQGLAHNCDDFLRHMRKHDPEGIKTYEVLNPDVPKLLTHFRGYLNDLRKRGILRDSLQFADKLRDEGLDKTFKEGSPVQQFNIAMSFRQGAGRKQDFAEAARWFLRSAEQGHAPAQYAIGVLYERGMGVRRDPAKALVWYRKSAEQGYMHAQHNLGVMYEDGNGVERDYARALDYYRRSAAQGHAPAQGNLGTMYANGRGVARDHGEAAKWYRKAADQGEMWGQYNLGMLYRRGKGGLGKDDAAAAELFAASAEQGLARAQARLAYLYRKGQGVGQDYRKALHWYRQAVAQDDANAQTGLAFMYWRGLGVEKDYKQAAGLYRRAAAKNNPAALNALGYMYEKGQGVKKNLKKAVSWYRQAIKQGSNTAKKNLARLQKENPGVVK